MNNSRQCSVCRQFSRTPRPIRRSKKYVCARCERENKEKMAAIKHWVNFWRKAIGG